MPTATHSVLSLAGLLDPLPVRDFLSGYWQKRFFHRTGASAVLTELERAFGSFEVPNLVHRHGGAINVWRREGNQVHTSEEEPERALELYEDGCTLYFDLLEVEPICARLVESVVDELGMGCTTRLCSIFACKTAGGVGSHFDANENFTIQLSGTKVWTVSSDFAVKHPIHNCAIEAPLIHPVSATYIPLGLTRESFGRSHEIEMSPGAVLYHPAGSLHSTLAGSASVSLNVCLEPLTMVDLIAGVLEARLMADPAIRRPLPIEGRESTAAELDELLADALTAAQRALASLDPQDAAVLTRLPPTAELDLLEVAARCRHALDPTTRLRTNDLTRFDRIRRNGDTSVLPVFAYLGQPPRRIDLVAPRALERACAAVSLQQGSWRPGELAAALPEEDLLTVARALVEIGALRLARA
jgi:50S ribosomal protein L16 3-hydroxylase